MNKADFFLMHEYEPTELGFKYGRLEQSVARNAPMNSEVKTEDELQAIIDGLPDKHNSALYEAVIKDELNEYVCTRYVRASSPERAELEALKKCWLTLNLHQAAFADVEMRSCQGSAFRGWRK